MPKVNRNDWLLDDSELNPYFVSEQDKVWENIEAVIVEGTGNEEIVINCPYCGGKIFYKYDQLDGTIEYGCEKCGLVSRGFGCF